MNTSEDENKQMLLRQLNWRFTLGVFQAEAKIDDWTDAVFQEDEGIIVTDSPPATGGKRTRVQWYRNEDRICFTVLGVI